MANICLYKIKVKGRKRACYALVDMMPLYSWEKEYLREEGTDDDFELVFLGGCKWSVDCYTTRMQNPVPFTDEELNAIQDGDHWDKNLQDKSVLLDCEIWCNSKDIDDSCWAIFDHYNRGKVIRDECPKELHIKRGRDYDQGSEIVVALNPTPHNTMVGRLCRVKFELGAYDYSGEYEVGDIVKVEGAKSGCIGRVIETIDSVVIGSLCKITECIGHADSFVQDEIEAIYANRKPVDRRPYLVSLGLDEKTTKKKFISVMDYKWTLFAIKNNDWKKFVELVDNADKSIVVL